MTKNEVRQKAAKLYRFGGDFADEFAEGGYEGFKDGAEWSNAKTLDEVSDYLRNNAVSEPIEDYINAMRSAVRVKQWS